MGYEFTDEDENSPIRTAEGERIGTVSDVNEGRASVEEDEGITDAIREALGWDSDDDESDRQTHDLSDAAVERVDDDGVWIRQI
ncbi:MAG: hypothetical protein IH933_14710 [Euryarchaeota archaeon]|jgi:hypothetical protein|nr:hypothetical protein [Euryarchaeota archaeon]